MCIEQGVCISSVKYDCLISVSVSNIRCHLRLVLGQAEVQLISLFPVHHKFGESTNLVFDFRYFEV